MIPRIGTTVLFSFIYSFTCLLIVAVKVCNRNATSLCVIRQCCSYASLNNRMDFTCLISLLDYTLFFISKSSLWIKVRIIGVRRVFLLFFRGLVYHTKLLHTIGFDRHPVSMVLGIIVSPVLPYHKETCLGIYHLR